MTVIPAHHSPHSRYLKRLKPGALGRLRWALHMKRRPRSLAAWLRLVWHDFVTHVLFEGGERCQDCGRGYILWRAEDRLYVDVIGQPTGLVCPACFDRRARMKGLILDWVPVVLKERVSR